MFLCRCIVPLITVLSPILDYGRCFLRHQYEHSMKLHNDSDLPAKYELLQQHINEDTPIIYKSPQPKINIDKPIIYKCPQPKVNTCIDTPNKYKNPQQKVNIGINTLVLYVILT